MADRQKAKQAAYEKMRKKKLRKLEIKVKCQNGRDPILILAQQVQFINDFSKGVLIYVGN